MRSLLRLVAVFLILVATSSFAATADIAVSQSFLTNAPGEQYGPVVASDGTNFLAVWSDGRSPLGGLYAARVDFRGQLLDATGIRIGAGAANGHPEVIWSGSSYVIVWTETAFSPSGGPRYSIRVARVSVAGALLEAPRTLRDNAVGYARNVATNGSRIVVAYTVDPGNAPRVTYAVLEHDAHAIALDVAVPQPAANNFGATATSNGSDFILVWTSTNGVANTMSATHVDATGNVVGARLIVQANAPADGALVVSDGTDFLIFIRDLSATRDALQVMRVNATLGIVTERHDVAVPNSVTVAQPRVVWNSGTYLLVWTDFITKSIFSTHLDRDGVALHGPIALADWTSSGLVADPNIASNGGGVLLVWNDSRFTPAGVSPSYDVMSRLVDQSILIANPERLISSSASRQTVPAIATGAGVTMTVWSEETGIYASRITPAGAIDGAGIKLSSSGGLPRIVFDGTNFLVSWLTLTSDDRSISTARIDRDGHIISANKVGDICAVGLALTRGATSSLLAWTTCDRRSIDAVRIGNDGNVIDSLPLRLTPANMNTGSLSAAWNGSEYLVAWEERLDVPTVILFPLYRFNVYATRVSGALTLIDSQPIPIAVSSDSEVSNSSPEVASDGDDFLIAWSSPSGVAAKHVSASGIPAESTPLFIGEGSEPDVAWDGNRYLVAWHTPTTIDAAHVDDAGQQLPNDRFTIVIPQLNNAGLDLVATAPGRVTATYTRIATEPQYGNVERAFVRTLPPPLGRIRVTRR